MSFSDLNNQNPLLVWETSAYICFYAKLLDKHQFYMYVFGIS